MIHSRTILNAILVILLASCAVPNQVPVVTTSSTTTIVIRTNPTSTATPIPTLTISPTSVDTAIPTHSPTETGTPVGGGNGNIYYLLGREIYKIRPDGAQETKIAIINDDISELQSPIDSGVLTYTPFSTNQLCSINKEGKFINCVDTGYSLRYPTGHMIYHQNYSFFPQQYCSELSPDGNYSAGTTNENKTWDLVVFDMNNKSKVFNIKSAPYISWSPDSSKILFSKRTSDDIRNWIEELFVINLDGTRKKQLTWFNNVTLFAEWSPSGDYVAFLGPVTNRECMQNIYIVEVATKKIEAMTNKMNVCWYDWSPDGEYLTFVGNPNSDTNYEIYIQYIDTKENIVIKEGLGKIFGLVWR